MTDSLQRPHSVTGIVSSIISILNITGLIIFLVYTYYSLNAEFNPDTIISAVFSSIFAGVFYVVILLSGLALGVVSLFTKSRKKFFGVLGIILSIVSAVIILLLIIVVTISGPSF